MPRVPTNEIGLPLKQLGDLWAAATTWQTWTESEDAAEALTKVYFYGEPASGLPAQFVVPHVMEWDSEKVGTGNTHRNRGQLGVLVYANVPGSFLDAKGKINDVGGAINDFVNTLGGVVTEFKAMVAANGDLYPYITRYHVSGIELHTSDPGETGAPYVQGHLLLDWG